MGGLEWEPPDGRLSAPGLDDPGGAGIRKLCEIPVSHKSGYSVANRRADIDSGVCPRAFFAGTSALRDGGWEHGFPSQLLLPGRTGPDLLLCVIPGKMRRRFRDQNCRQKPSERQK